MSTGDAKQLSNATLGHRSAKSSDLLNLIGGQFDVLPAPKIDRLRNRLQVIRVHAASVPAKVVELHPLRNGADVALVDDSVSGVGLSASGECLPVPTAVKASLPNPTPILVNDVLNRGLAAVVSCDEVSRMPRQDSSCGIVPSGNGGSLAATAPAEPIFNAIGADRNDILRARHSLTSLAGRGVSRARGVTALPGISLPKLYHFNQPPSGRDDLSRPHSGRMTEAHEGWKDSQEWH